MVHVGGVDIEIQPITARIKINGSREGRYIINSAARWWNPAPANPPSRRLKAARPARQGGRP